MQIIEFLTNEIVDHKIIKHYLLDLEHKINQKTNKNIIKFYKLP